MGRTDGQKALAHLSDARKALAGHAEGLWNVADLYIDAGEPDKAKEVLSELNADGSNPATDYLRARLDFNEGKFGAAAALLEERRPALAASPELSRQADLLLGLCYQRLGNPDQQLAAFRRAAEEAPDWPPALLGRASALLAAGKSDEALAEYSDVVKRDPRLLDARLQAVRLLILRTLRLPSDKRDWTAVAALLDAAPEDQRKAPEFRLARIDLLVARGQLDEARSSSTRLAVRRRKRSVTGWCWPTWPAAKRVGTRRRGRRSRWRFSTRPGRNWAIRWTFAWRGPPESPGWPPRKR